MTTRRRDFGGTGLHKGSGDRGKARDTNLCSEGTQLIHEDFLLSHRITTEKVT